MVLTLTGRDLRIRIAGRAYRLLHREIAYNDVGAVALCGVDSMVLKPGIRVYYMTVS